MIVNQELRIVPQETRHHSGPVCRGVEDEFPLGSECGHREEGSRSIEHCVANLEVLELRQEMVSAWRTLLSEEVPIDPVVPSVGIPAGPLVAHLHEPQPGSVLPGPHREVTFASFTITKPSQKQFLNISGS